MGVRRGKGAESEERDVGGRGGAKKCWQVCPAFPQRMVPTTCPQSQRVWDRRVCNAVATLIDSFLSVHTHRVQQAFLLQFRALLFLLYLYGLWRTHHPGQDLLWNLWISVRCPNGCCHVTCQSRSVVRCEVFWLYSTAPWEIFFHRKKDSELQVDLVYRCLWRAPCTLADQTHLYLKGAILIKIAL